MKNAPIEKAARDCAPAALENTDCKLHSNGFSIAILLWRFAYSLEETRQRHAALSNFWREAGACVLLAILKIGRLA